MFFIFLVKFINITLFSIGMSKKNISMTDFEGNPNIGIYMYANDKFCLVGPKISEIKKKEIEKTLKVPVYNLTVLGTELIGVFLTGNNEFLMAPEMHDFEKKEFEKICAKHDVKLIVLNEIQNTFGNNICVGDGEILINPDYLKKFEDDVKKKTGFKTIKIKNDEFKAVGSTCRFLNGKYFISQQYKEAEVKTIIDKIGGVGTINSGSNFISSGVVGNSFGVIIGSMSSTVEIQAIVENLDYL